MKDLGSSLEMVSGTGALHLRPRGSSGVCLEKKRNFGNRLYVLLLIFIFPVQLTTSMISNLSWLNHSLAIYVTMPMTREAGKSEMFQFFRGIFFVLTGLFRI